MEDLKKKKNLLIIGIATLVVVLLGSTYAFFTYSKTIKAFTLTSNSIKAEFQSGTNSINIAYAYPISDSFAKDNLDKLGYLDFTVTGAVSDNKEAVTYEIYLTEDSNNTLDSSFIKVYLTDDNKNEVVSPSIYNGLPAPTLGSASDGKVILTKTEPGTFESKYRIYAWIDEGYTQNVEHQTFSFKVNLYAYNDVAPKTGTDTVKEKVVSNVTDTCTASDFNGGLVAINTEGTLYQEDSGQEIREYRYVGPDVDNYIYFNCQDGKEQNGDNCEIWRILGIFKDESGAEHIKIVRNETLKGDMMPSTYTAENGTEYNIRSSSTDNAYWNYKTDRTYNNDWTTGGLQYWLNAGSDKETKQASDGYMSYLSKNAKSMIENTKYYLGNFNYSTDTAISSYVHERGNAECSGSCSGGDIWEGNQAEWNGNIVLMYPSDYGYSGNSCNWTESLVEYSGNTSSWLNSANHSTYEWLLSPSSYGSSHVAGWGTTGGVGYSVVFGSYAVRPSLNLISGATIVDGEGTADTPYKLNSGQ